MALPALSWKQLPTQVLTSGYTINTLLDAIYTAFQSTTYINGDARTPGSGQAWTMSRYQNAGATESVYGGPPTNALNQQVLLSGSTGAKVPTPTMIGASGGYAVNRLNIGLSKNSGAFTSWNAALPFGVGSSFTGYSYGFGVTANNISVRCFESADGIYVAINLTSTGSPGAYLFAGGIIDPEQGSAPPNCETDGKIYCIGNGFPGNASYDGGNSTQNIANQTLFAHNYQASVAYIYNYCVAFTPGAGTVLGLARANRGYSTGASYATRGGLYARTPILLNFTDSLLNYTNPPITWAGRLREICLTRLAASGTTLKNGATDVGYYLSDNAGTSTNSVILSV